MKRILFILCLFIALVTLAINAAAFQKCVDKNGDLIITDNPPPGAKCESSGENEEATSQDDNSAKKQESDVESEQSAQKDKASSQKSEINRLKKIPRLSY
jgi:hypothetical protein